MPTISTSYPIGTTLTNENFGTFKKGRREGVHIYIQNTDYEGLKKLRDSWRYEKDLKDHLKQAQAVIDVFQRESDKMFLRYIVKGNIGSSAFLLVASGIKN